MQSGAIRGLVGERRVLTEPCNLPVSGGSSLSSILWFRDEQPEVWTAAAKFGHCNTYLVKRMTGRWAIDALTSSMTGLYNTVSNDLTWNRSILGLAGIPEAKLPHLMHSHERVGRVLPVVADELGVPSGCSVLCGGNDAELAALSGGLTEPGDINIISGTCDMANVCTDRPAASPDFNVHGHVVPGRWLTFFVLNAGGAALDWLRRIPCSELILETTREDLLLSLVRGNATYLGENLKEVTALVRVGRRVGISGGGSGVRGMLEARRRRTGEYEYVFQDQSSLLGAAILGQMSQLGRLPGSGQVTAGDI